MTLNIHGYEIKMIGGKMAYIQITRDEGRYLTSKAAYGATARRAIAQLKKLRVAGDDEALRVWLCTVSCGFWS